MSMSHLKQYPRIASKIFNEPWVIVPSMHSIIRAQFMAHIKGNHVELPAPVVEPLDDSPIDVIPAVPSVSVIPVFGILGKHLSALETECGGCSVDALVSQLKAAKEDASVSSIVLWFNSPGGTVTGIAEAGEVIAEVDAIKPVFAYTDGQCCSGAYWLASQCRAILTSPSADIGSIGVYQLFCDETKALEMEGIKIDPIYKGEFKLAGASFKPLTDSERAMFQAGVDRTYEKFVAAIQSKRELDTQFCQGQVFDGEQAITNGLADGVANDIGQVIALISQEVAA